MCGFCRGNAHAWGGPLQVNLFLLGLCIPGLQGPKASALCSLQMSSPGSVSDESLRHCRTPMPTHPPPPIGSHKDKLALCPHTDSYCFSSHCGNASGEVKSDFLWEENQILHFVRQTGRLEEGGPEKYSSPRVEWTEGGAVRRANAGRADSGTCWGVLSLLASKSTQKPASPNLDSAPSQGIALTVHGFVQF